MKQLLILIVAIAFTSNLQAQCDTFVHPEFPGGDIGLQEYLKKNLKYPRKAKKKGIEGKVYVRFVVEKDGSVSNVKLVKGIGGGCDEIALKLIKKSPKWKPAEERYKPTKCRMVVPVSFRLDPKK